MTGTSRFGLHGLAVASPVELPAVGWVDHDAPDVDLHVRRVATLPEDTGCGAVMAETRDARSGRAYTLRRSGSEWSMRLHGAAHCRFSDPVVRGVTSVEIECVVPDDLLSVLVAGPVMTAVAIAAGHQVLHASAVALADGSAWAFTAPSGGGKTTVAALLSSEGRLLMSDDALVVSAGPLGPRAWPGTLGSRVRPGSPLGRADSRRTADGRLLPPVPAVRTVAAREVVRAHHVVLDPTVSRSTMTGLDGLDALRVLLAASPLDGVQGTLLERRFGESAELVEALSVVELRVAWRGGETELDRLREELLSLLEGGGPLAG